MPESSQRTRRLTCGTSAEAHRERGAAHAYVRVESGLVSNTLHQRLERSQVVGADAADHRRGAHFIARPLQRANGHSQRRLIEGIAADASREQVFQLFGKLRVHCGPRASRSQYLSTTVNVRSTRRSNWSTNSQRPSNLASP